MAQKIFQGRLFRKYFLYFVVLVCGVLLVGGAVGLYFSYRETHAALVVLQREKALGAAARIEQFTREIEQQVGWTHMPQVGGPRAREQRHLDFLRLLRQAPAITDVSWLDRHGREQLKVSRLSLDRANSGADFSRAAKFLEPRQGATYFSPVYFHQETEPYMTIAMPAGHGGVTVAEVNLKFVWDVVSRIRVGESGYAYVVDARGRLVSHPDISRVLQNTDLSALPQVRAVLGHVARSGEEPDPPEGRDRDGQFVLAAHAVIAPLGWMVFVEQPLSEAYASLYAAMARNGVLLFLGLGFAVAASLVLARRMVMPIQALRAGAQRIGAGALDANIEIRTGDELETLAEEFNHMAARLRESYAGLEQKVAERTQELAAANLAKVRFIAAASHDLRQPLHAQGLFVEELQARNHDAESRRILANLKSSMEAMHELFNSLLDISRLDASVVEPKPENFSINILLRELHLDFFPLAREKKLAFRIADSCAVVHSDPRLLKRIMRNLVSNAIRYTNQGKVLVGCRRRGDRLQIQVWDTGVGIHAADRKSIFEEFHQLHNPERDRRKGLGLGLAIVNRLAALMHCPIEIRSQVNKGSMFSVTVPFVGTAATEIPPPSVPVDWTGDLSGHTILVIDDEPEILRGMKGLLEQWGCRVLTAESIAQATAHIRASTDCPAAIVADYRLRDRETGIEAIACIRSLLKKEIPGLLITGDTAPERLQEAYASGYRILHKPVPPARLRALLGYVIRKNSLPTAPEENLGASAVLNKRQTSD